MLLGNKIALFGGIGLLILAGSTWAMTKAYLNQRDKTAEAHAATQRAVERINSYARAYNKLKARQEALEAHREALANEIEGLRNQEIETITEIREVWRDREVIVQQPVSVECAREPVPTDILHILCTKDTGTTCRDLRAATAGLISGLPAS